MKLPARFGTPSGKTASAAGVPGFARNAAPPTVAKLLLLADYLYTSSAHLEDPHLYRLEKLPGAPLEPTIFFVRRSGNRGSSTGSEA